MFFNHFSDNQLFLCSQCYKHNFRFIGYKMIQISYRVWLKWMYSNLGECLSFALTWSSKENNRFFMCTWLNKYIFIVFKLYIILSVFFMTIPVVGQCHKSFITLVSSILSQNLVSYKKKFLTSSLATITVGGQCYKIFKH